MEKAKSPNDIVNVVDGRSVGGTEFRLITLNNPGKANCLSLRMFDCLEQSLEEANVGLILFNSKGSVFSSGLDLDELYECGTPKAHLMRLRDLVYAIEGHSATTMSIVSGSVVAGGIAVACCTDVTLAEEEALFSVPNGQEYRPLVRYLKALVFAYRPQADIDPFAERQIRASQAKTLIDETFLYEAGDPIEIAVRLAESRDIPKRRIGTRQRKDVDEALSEAIQPAAIEGLLGSRARLHNGS